MNPCPRCGTLDQVRTVRSILQNDVQHTTSVGTVRMHGRVSGSRAHMAGSMSQHFVVSSPLAKTLAGTVFLDPRYAGMTRNRASAPLTIVAWALPLIVAVVAAKLIGGSAGDLVTGALCFPVVLGIFTVPIGHLVTNRLDHAATAADLPKQHGRQRADQRGALFETLVYCGRDHLVYNPRTGAHFPPEETTGYLFHSIPEVEFIAVTDNLDDTPRPTDLPWQS